MKPIIYFLAGQSGSGKTWVSNQLAHKFTLHDSDTGTYEQLVEKINTSTKPVLYTSGIRISTFINKNPQWDVRLITILDSVDNITNNILKRGGQGFKSVESRNKRLLTIARLYNPIFSGNSTQCLTFLQGLEVESSSTPKVEEKKAARSDYYVYRYIRWDTMETFYIGKGKDNRYKSLSNRNKHFLNIVKSISYTVEKMFTNLTEEQAFTKEIELINSYKGINQASCNLTDGGEGTSGRVVSEETRKRNSLGNLGRKHTIETRNKVSKAGKGRIISDKTKILKRQTSPHSKPVIDIITGKEYFSIAEASRQLNINQGTLAEYLRGKSPNKTNLRYKS